MKKAFVTFLAFSLILLVGIGTGGYIALVTGVPSIEEIKGYRFTHGTKVYADDDTLIKEFSIEKGEYVPVDTIPEHLINAVIAVEDARFWAHRGVDYIAILRALYKDIMAGGFKEGGSTITQQLAKVAFLSPERTVMRKLKEATLAYRLEKNLNKREILELYLNKIYFGRGAYGVEMAARSYFGKSVGDIDLAEAAMLCGIIKAPARFSPYNNLDRAKERQRIVLSRMLENNYITNEQADSAYKKPLYLSSLRYGRESQNYFLEYVRRYLEETYGTELVSTGRLKVYTTLNREMQEAAVSSLKEGLRELDKRQGYRGPLEHREIDVSRELNEIEPFKKVQVREGDRFTATVLKVSPREATVKTQGVIGTLLLSDTAWASKLVDQRGSTIKRFNPLKLTDILRPGDIIEVKVKTSREKNPLFLLEQEPVVQGAVIAIEQSTGYIRVLVGGYDFSKSEFNRTVNARRQAGSSFKPIIYAAAMTAGFTPASIIVDEPVSYPAEIYNDWEPENYDAKYRGPTRLRDALAHSINIVTIKLLDAMKVRDVIRLGKSLGIEGPYPYDLTIALGSLSVSPLEMTSAFSVFANDGIRMKPVVIKYIRDADGRILEENKPRGVRVLDSQTSFLVTSMLEDVVRYGTGQLARRLNRHVAGKTGTSNEFKDAWFIGYTPEITAGVWVGFDDMRTLGKKETGSRAALPIWVSFMGKALSIMSPFNGKETEAIRSFPVPDGIITTVIDPLTGLLATNESGKLLEVFREGTAPSEYSTSVRRNQVIQQKEALRSITRHSD